MTQRMQELASEILRLQAELELEIEQRRQTLGWSIVKNKIIEFEHGIVAEHRGCARISRAFSPTRRSRWSRRHPSSIR